MKKISALLWLLFILSATRESSAINIVNAKTSLTGKITDQETGQAIAGATIYIPDLKTGAATDTARFYRIDNLPRRKLLIQVMFLGYKTAIERVDLATTHTMDFVLKQTIAEVNEIVVTGTSRATEIRQNPVPMATIDSRMMQQNLNTNVIDVIAKLPGISAVTTGPNVSKPFIHGLGFNRVLTLYDGVRQEGQQWGDEHGIEVDENSVDRIEVVKGPASLTYGSDALAGVVNLIPAPPVPNGTMKGRALADYQFNNGLYSGAVSLAGNNNGFVWGGTASHKQATNYQNKYDGRVYGTSFNETDLNGNIGLTKHWGYANVNFSLFDDLQEIPDGSRDSISRKFTRQITENDFFRPIVTNSELSSYKIAPMHQHVQHYRVYSSNSFIIGNGKIGLLLGDQTSVRREFSHPESPDLAGLYLVLNTLTYDLKYYLPEFNKWETTLGINGMFQNNTNKGTEFIIPDYRQFDLGPFALVQKSFHKLALSAGVRYDSRRFNNDEMFVRSNPQTGYDMQVSSPNGAEHIFLKFKHTFSGFSGSIGATYNLSNSFLIKGNIARGFRAPNIAEISANGVHPGTLIYQIGNTEFKPEFSLQGDLGVSYSSSHVTGNIEIFNNTITNYIFNQKLLNNSGGDSIMVKGNQTFKFQQAKAQLYGGEVSLDIHPHPLDWLHFENSLSLIYGSNRGGNGVQLNENNKYLPFIPPLHTNSELRANVKRKLNHFSSIYAKIGMEYYAKQDRVYSAYGTETPTPGYTLFNAGIGTALTNSHGKVLFTIDILENNITDLAYQSHLSRLKYFEPYPNNLTGRSGIYNMGRNISLKLIVPLEM